MPRIPFPEFDAMREDVRKSIGDDPANVVRMLAGLSPEVNRGFGALTEALFKRSPLPATLREIAIVRVGHLCGSAYEVFQHEPFARHVGVSETQLAQLSEDRPDRDHFDEAERAVLAFTDDLVRNVRASDETLAGVRAHLDDPCVLDLILVIGTYMTVSRFLETTGVEIDDRPIDWDAYSKRD